MTDNNPIISSEQTAGNEKPTATTAFRVLRILLFCAIPSFAIYVFWSSKGLDAAQLIIWMLAFLCTWPIGAWIVTKKPVPSLPVFFLAGLSFWFVYLVGMFLASTWSNHNPFVFDALNGLASIIAFAVCGIIISIGLQLKDHSFRAVMTFVIPSVISCALFAALRRIDLPDVFTILTQIYIPSICGSAASLFYYQTKEKRRSF